MVEHEIIGDDMQAVILTPRGGRRGARRSRRDDVHDRRHRDGRPDGGRLARRAEAEVSGRRELFLTYFRCTPARRGSPSPDRIPARSSAMRSQQRPLLCQNDSFLCAAGEIDINIAFTKRIGAGFFGGEGFILQKMEGTGEAVHPQRRHHRADGAAGRASAAVDTGCLVAFDPTVDYDIVRVGGIKTVAVRRRRAFLRGDDRAGPRLAPDPAVLAARRPHPLGVPGDREDVKRDMGGVFGALGDLIGGDQIARGLGSAETSRSLPLEDGLRACRAEFGSAKISFCRGAKGAPVDNESVDQSPLKTRCCASGARSSRLETRPSQSSRPGSTTHARPCTRCAPKHRGRCIPGSAPTPSPAVGALRPVGRVRALPAVGCGRMAASGRCALSPAMGCDCSRSQQAWPHGSRRACTQQPDGWLRLRESTRPPSAAVVGVLACWPQAQQRGWGRGVSRWGVRHVALFLVCPQHRGHPRSPSTRPLRRYHHN